MARKCVSLGNPGISGLPPGGEAIVDLYAGVTAPPSPENNLSYFSDTDTGWVRLFAEWDFLWPSPPTTTTTTLPNGQPDPAHYRWVSPAPDQATLLRLDVNIALAKASGLGVILTTIGCPSWLNGSTNKFVFPPDSALGPASSKPPNGSQFEPTDFMYNLWAHYLMFRYHPGNAAILNHPVINGQRCWIDSFELVNEPDVQGQPHLPTPSTGLGKQQSRVRTTTLMMASAQTIKNELNKKYTPKIAVLGPATAQPPPVGGSPTDFTTLLIASLKKPITFAGASKSYSFNPKDAQFGWSQHNYGDVEHVANMLGTFPPAVLVGILQLQHPEFFFSLFYGGGTQRVRNLLRSGGTTTAVTAGTSWWQGAKSASDPNPGLWLSEGGCRLDNVVVFPGTRYPRTATGALVDPSTNYSTNPPSDPVPGFKQLQGWAIAGAANALSRNGGGPAWGGSRDVHQLPLL